MRPGVGRPLLDQAAAEPRLQAAGERDHAIRVAVEQLGVDARLAAAEALQEAGRGELDEVAKAGLGGRQQGEVVALDALIGAAPIVDQVGLESDDRLDPVRLARLVVLDRAVHHAVVGEPERGHPQLRRPGGQAIDLAGAVEQRVLAVDVEVDRLGARHGLIISVASRCHRHHKPHGARFDS